MAQPSITQTSLNAMTQGSAFSQTLSATAAPPDTATFTVRHDSTDGGFDTQGLTLTVEDEVVSSSAWFEEDFESYANTAALFATHTEISDDDTDPRLVTGLTGTPWGGTKAFERHWPTDQDPGEECGCRIFFPDASADQPSEIWAEYYVNFDDYDNSRSGDKICFFFDEDFNRWDLPQDAGGTLICTAGVAGVINDGDPNETVRWKTAFPNGSVIQMPADWVGQGWIQIRLHCVMGRGAANGSLRCWQDGTLVFENNDPFESNEAGDYFNAMQFGANTAAAAGASQYFSGLKVYTSDPGW